ncbi:hypothetical protein TWF696_007417 [Orbilia brochopaga]|uniref:Uncharacterized protein n=1 Tax=Orbilia brochopaga TaxID=3140254 RepID=A0AAV9UTC8_9PEZI
MEWVMFIAGIYIGIFSLLVLSAIKRYFGTPVTPADQPAELAGVDQPASSTGSEVQQDSIAGRVKRRRGRSTTSRSPTGANKSTTDGANESTLGADLSTINPFTPLGYHVSSSDPDAELEMLQVDTAFNLGTMRMALVKEVPGSTAYNNILKDMDMEKAAFRERMDKVYRTKRDYERRYSDDDDEPSGSRGPRSPGSGLFAWPL